MEFKRRDREQLEKRGTFEIMQLQLALPQAWILNENLTTVEPQSLFKSSSENRSGKRHVTVLTSFLHDFNTSDSCWETSFIHREKLRFTLVRGLVDMQIWKPTGRYISLMADRFKNPV